VAFKAAVSINVSKIVALGAIRQMAGSIAVTIKPNQPVPGNNSPAEQSGDAQPMMPNGGTALIAKPNGTRQRSWGRFVVQAAAQGAASSEEAPIHIGTAYSIGGSGPKKFRAAGITGHVAPA
jgi:hypothetical protein